MLRPKALPMLETCTTKPKSSLNNSFTYWSNIRYKSSPFAFQWEFPSEQFEWCRWFHLWVWWKTTWLISDTTSRRWNYSAEACCYSQVLTARVHQVHLINRQLTARLIRRAETQKNRKYSNRFLNAGAEMKEKHWKCLSSFFLCHWVQLIKYQSKLFL